jgi:hypothetical protein
LTGIVGISFVSYKDRLSFPFCQDHTELVWYNEGVALGWHVPAFQAEGTTSAARLLFYRAGRGSN